MLALSALLVWGCHTGDPTAVRRMLPGEGLSGAIDANATVRFINIETGCWVLETATGRFEPLNLPAQYQVDGLRVYVKFTGAPSAVSVCMVAPLVHIDEIRTW